MKRLLLIAALCLVLPAPAAFAQTATPDGAEAAETEPGADASAEEEVVAEEETQEEAEEEAEAPAQAPPAPATTTEEPAAAAPAATAPEDEPVDSVTIAYVGEADPEGSSRLVIPPFLFEQRGDVRTTAVFPFYFERSAPDDFQLLAGPYFQRRSATEDADVVFPFVWSFRGEDASTLVVPPFYHRTRPEGFDLGVAPLFFTGRKNDSVYTVIPALLTLSIADEHNALTIAGPVWRTRDETDVNWGLFPLLWGGSGLESSHFVLAPVFFHFEEENGSTTVVPPFFYRRRDNSVLTGLAPLFVYASDDNSSSLTTPLFHYEGGENDFQLYTWLGGYVSDEDSSTLITPVYQRHRGSTQLDASFPFFMSLRDPRDRSSLTMVTPLVWHAEAPASSTTVAFPFFAQIHEEGRYDTLLTLLYWDLQKHESQRRASIFFPVYWRFRNGEDVTQLAGNTFYRSRVRQGIRDWEFHFFPLFAFGETAPGTHWWTVLYGLAEYRSHGETGTGKALWVPFDVH